MLKEQKGLILDQKPNGLRKEKEIPLISAD